MSDILVLHSLLLLAFILAPILTNAFFLQGYKPYAVVHKVGLTILIVGLLLNWSYASFVWPLFCAYGFFLFCKNKFSVTPSIPFVFSLISSVWYVAATNDLHLLGYDQAWSFYAALHGSFLGWIFVGCLAFLSRNEESGRVYVWGCYASFLFFLMVAFGIDGIPYIKRIGVFGFAVMMPLLIGYFAFNLKKESKLARSLSLLSLVAMILSMGLAVANEFAVRVPMVITHGLLNALVAVPAFFLAVKLEKR